MTAYIFDFVGVVGRGRMATSADPGDTPYIVELVPEVEAAIRRLRSAGISTAMISNNDRDHFSSQLPQIWAAVQELFDVIVFSSDIGVEKPDRRIYEHALTQLDLKASECHYFDDLARNVDAAVAVGMTGTVVTTASDVIQSLP